MHTGKIPITPASGKNWTVTPLPHVSSAFSSGTPSARLPLRFSWLAVVASAAESPWLAIDAVCVIVADGDGPARAPSSFLLYAEPGYSSHTR